MIRIGTLASVSRGFGPTLVLAGLLAGCSGAAPDGGSPRPGTQPPGGAGTPGGGGSTIDTDPQGIGSGCGVDVYQSELMPLDLFVMLDRSGSMSDLGKWSSVTGAIKDFMTLPDLHDFSLGIQFFPLAPATPPPVSCVAEADCGTYGPCFFGACLSALGGMDSCDANDYRQPAVPITGLPAAASSIITAIDGQTPGGSTPMAPALEGAIDYAQTWAADHPAHAVAVVLATDGEPSACNPGTIQTVAARAAEGYAQTPSVKTFVIGIGQSLASLNLIASGGGTDKALVISDANAGSEFLDALDHIRGGLSCTMSIPEPTSGTANLNMLNVAHTPNGGSQAVVPRVGSPSECGGEPGWHYDNPAAPSKIQLCPASCDDIQANEGTMEVVIGCEAVVK